MYYLILDLIALIRYQLGREFQHYTAEVYPNKRWQRKKLQQFS